ncbi:DUF4333 domain-containing protein [Nocardioides zeae]|uniref:DUF4333 domain-containing protein n=1 Tax=Nocardioides zeae TaxID=1457234 RepID=A0A6P0HLF5_9ACTN|nr:DUF4333 domain-containing protein [Nocardioides zeae]
MNRLLAAAATGASVLLLSACSGGTVDQGDLEDQVKSSLTETVGQAPKDIDCPDELEAEEGATTTCVLTADDDSTIDVEVEVTSVDGDRVDLDIQVADEVN